MKPTFVVVLNFGVISYTTKFKESHCMQTETRNYDFKKLLWPHAWKVRYTQMTDVTFEERKT